MKHLSILLLLMATHLGYAQQNIKGTLYDGQGKAIEFANVLLVKASDSSLVKGTLSTSSGTYQFDAIAPGYYRVLASMVGYQKAGSAPFEVTAEGTTLTVLALRLQEVATQLKEVTVRTQKPLIEQHHDKTVLNVENSIIAAGSTALEVMEKAPGLVIDQNDNISMRGRQGVIVMIDGKPVPMSGAELANMLRGMSANSIEKIDLITNPSAKYDASGNAGIIDIRLKKDKRLGSNGSLSSSFGHGYFGKSNQSLQLNHRSSKFNVFGNYSYVYRRDFTNLDIYRRFYEGPAYLGAYDQQNRFNYAFHAHTLRAGVDYYLGPKTIIGLVANGNLFSLKRFNTNQSAVLNAQQVATSTFVTEGRNAEGRANQGLNLNAKHTFGESHELSADLDYIAYGRADLQNFTTNYYNLQGEPLRSPYLLHGDLLGGLSIASAKVDYTLPLPSLKANLEAGAKSSLVSANNKLSFFDRSEGRNEPDLDKSNHFLYSENINAAYVNANRKWTKASLQLGLRLENTIANGRQLSDGQQFNRNYTQLFPSGAFTYTAGKDHNLGVSVSRRINRPTYNQLNPFKNFLDPSTYSAGNPFLLPELSYSFELNHTYKQKFLTKLSYSRTSDVMLNVLSPDPSEEKLVVQTFRNLATLDYYGLTVSVPFSAGNWFQSVNNGTFYYGLYQGNVADTDLRNGRPTFNLNSNNTFLLPGGWSAELNGVYRHREIYGFLDVRPIWFASAGIQKQFWDKKGTLKLNITDGFYTNQVRATTALTGYSESFYQRRDSRVATLTFSYRFGKNGVAPSRKRNSGAEDEKRRAE